jgi:AcrR family transcriptional regulator
MDAALDLFCRMGIQRSSMEDVAKRAAISRITIYRRFATKNVLVDEVILREFRRYFDQFLADIKKADTATDRVVLGFVSSLRAIRGNPLIGGLLAGEPELLAGSMMGDDGAMLASVRQFVAGQLRREQEAGLIAESIDTDRAAEMMARVSASFLTIPSQLVDLDDDAQLTALAHQFIVPMLQPLDAYDTQPAR